MSNTIFESGDKCPPLLIIRGQMSSYIIFYRGANVRGGKYPTLPSHSTCILVVKLVFTGVHIVLNFLLNIDCRYSLEPLHQDGSNMYPRSMF